MDFGRVQKCFKKFKNSYTKIPNASWRLKGQRLYNQRNTASLFKTPCNKKKLMQSGLFSRLIRNTSNQRKKTKGLNKSTISHVSQSFTESSENRSYLVKLEAEKQTFEKNRSTTKIKASSDDDYKEIKSQEDKPENGNLSIERSDVKEKKSRLRVMSQTTEGLKTQLESTKGFTENSWDVLGKSTPKSSSSWRKSNNLLEDLYNQRNFKVKPTVLHVYNVTENTEVEHPDSVDGISWNYFREEKYRLLSFLKYPVTAVKSAMLLAEHGFVYTGTGDLTDDTVTCYFCCVQKNNWQVMDTVTDIHRELSLNCSMVTKISCDNIPIGSSLKDGLNFDNVLNQLNSTCRNQCNQHRMDNHTVEGLDTHANVSQHSRDIDADCGQDERQPASVFNQTSSIREIPQENQAYFQHLLSTESSTTATSRLLQSNPPNRAAQTTLASVSFNQNVASVTSSPQIMLPNISSESRNTVVNNGLNSSNFLGHTSLTPAGQPHVEISALTSISSNSVSVSQTTTNNGEKKNGKGPSYAELGIITERPKKSEYAVKETRMKTFESWPPNHKLKPDDLSDAGFYYAGYGDCARCFYCGGGLRNWEDEDDVWVEHARWFPKCAYIRQQMGQVFVDTVQELNKTFDVISFAMVKERCKAPGTASSLDAKMEPLKRDPAVLTVVDFGYSLTDVLQVAKIIKGKDVILSSDVLLTKLQELKKQRITKTPSAPTGTASSATLFQDAEAIRQIKEKNNQLRQQTVCKICMDKEVAVVFLPCGHLVSCAECASAMKDCPVCRVTVKGVVRAFI